VFIYFGAATLLQALQPAQAAFPDNASSEASPLGCTASEEYKI